MTSGEIGMESQAQGLAAAVGLPFDIKTVHLKWPWTWLPGHWVPNVLALPARNWPRLLITCGRRSVPFSIAIRKASGGQTFTVHIQDPKVPPSYFDMVVAPRHDGFTGANVEQSRVALHRITRVGLAAAANHFALRFADLPHPRVAVLIGGISNSFDFTAEDAAKIGEQLAALGRNGAGLMVTTSRRTGAENTAIIAAKLAGTPHVLWAGEGENPYLGMLALADHILATPDSVSMVSEACFTGKPVQIIPLKGGGKRFDAFHEGLRQDGYARPFNGALESWSYEPPDETRRIAALIRERLSLPG
jgi:mitochondrial fission protein ELM1